MWSIALFLANNVDIWPNTYSICRRSSRMPGDAICSDARLKYWEEEWLSELLSEALRLKKLTPEEEAEAAASAKGHDLS